MDTIRVFVEDIIRGWGLSESVIPFVRHAILLLIATLLAFLADVLCRRLIVPLINKLTRHTKAKWDDILFGAPVLNAACDIVPAVIVWWLLPLVFYQYPTVQELLARLTAIYITITSVRLCLVFINQLNKLDKGPRTSMQQYVVSFIGVLRIVAIFIGGIVVVAIAIGRSPLTLIAGLGATSAVLMLVFKDSIEGLVAGIRLTSADMLHVGDWITVPSTGANGTVTEMSLTTVKVQNFDNTIVTISPKTLVSGSFQNWKGMQTSGGRRVNRRFYIDFRSIHYTDNKKTTTNIGQYRDAIEEYLRNNELVNTSMTFMARQLEATQCGLPIEVYFFLKQKTWVDYEHQLAGIMEHIYCMAADYGLKIYEQYPEQ